MAYDLEFEHRPPMLRACLAGAQRDYDSTVRAWRRIAAEVRERQPDELLVVSKVQGEPFTMAQVEAFIAAVHGMGLEALRIAYVYPQVAGWREIEAAEILATEAGFEARAFPDESTARMWLHHGER